MAHEFHEFENNLHSLARKVTIDPFISFVVGAGFGYLILTTMSEKKNVRITVSLAIGAISAFAAYHNRKYVLKTKK